MALSQGFISYTLQNIFIHQIFLVKFMHELTLFHNPRCSKSRQTLELLQAQGLKPKIQLYLENPPTKSELKYILELLKLDARSLMRTKEAEYLASGLDNNNLTEDELIEAMIRIPKLIERPIVLANGRAVIGRPPENVLSIL